TDDFWRRTKHRVDRRILQRAFHSRHCMFAKKSVTDETQISQCYASAVERVTSRQNSIVAKYRAAARGDAVDVLLLDGAHLVNDALTALIPLEHVMVAAESAESA